MTTRPTLFAGPFLERRAELRDDPEWISAARNDAATRFLLTSGAAQLVTGGPSVEIAFLNGSHELVAGARDEDLTLLGWYRGERCVLVEVSDSTLAHTALPDSEFRELRPLAPLLSPDSASLLAYARALALWKGRHRHCGLALRRGAFRLERRERLRAGVRFGVGLQFAAHGFHWWLLSTG